VKRAKEQAIPFQQQRNLDCRARIPEEEIMIPAQDSWATIEEQVSSVWPLALSRGAEATYGGPWSTGQVK
jgi:hypothetical protein